ncbi:MAG TPA: hypothetical protein VLA66_13560 [Thermoanaerobaculia bacterium]|nr:hypothetical protein [Thermoanaerobaculia bacterium]
MVRLLVLDQCRILPLRVGREVPPGVEIVATTSVREAERLIRFDPPDAAVVSLTPASVDWPAFQRLCARHQPPIPVLYESCVHSAAAEIGLEAGDGYAAFLPKPSPAGELRLALVRLLEEAEQSRGPSAGGALRAELRW